MVCLKMSHAQTQKGKDNFQQRIEVSDQTVQKLLKEAYCATSLEKTLIITEQPPTSTDIRRALQLFYSTVLTGKVKEFTLPWTGPSVL